jgi:hypothetical protein
MKAPPLKSFRIVRVQTGFFNFKVIDVLASSNLVTGCILIRTRVVSILMN